MMKPIQIFLIILLFCALPLRADESLPVAFEAEFTIFKKGIEVAKIHRRLEHLANGDYVYRSETHSTGLASIFYKLHIVEESRWTQHEQYLRSLHYSYNRIRKKKEKHRTIVFDWENHRANYVHNGKASTVELQDGMTDKLLYQINLMRDLKIGQHPESYTVVGGGGVKTYYFAYLGEELVETPIGRFNTVKIVRQKPGEGESIILWCAKALHYLPIKIESKERDSITVAVINSLAGLVQQD